MIGFAAGLGSAVTWAFANFIFSRNLVSCPPMLFNFLTGVVAIVIFIMCLPLVENAFPQTSFTFYMLLQLSGVVGIGLGDSLFFSAIKNIGPRKTLLMETLASPFTGLISFLYFGDSISFFAWVGMFIVVYGIILVVQEQQKSAEATAQELIDIETVGGTATTKLVTETEQDLKNSQLQMRRGYMYAVGAMFCQALGMVLSRDALNSGQFNPITASLIRQMAGQFSVLLLLILSNERIFIPQQTRKQNINLFIGIVLGQVICLWLQQVALAYTRAEIAQTLLSTTPLFALAISKYNGETISRKAVIGSFTAFLGVVLIVNTNTNNN